jgi:hypothetical protein
MQDEQKFKAFIERVESMKKNAGLDLSTEEDLSLAIMNLISLEEHFFFTGVKTEKSEYFDMLNETREMRKRLLGKMIDKKEGEVWCISKHLLSGTMRLMEVGTKLQNDGNKEEAEQIFKDAYKLYSLFFALRLKLINIDSIKDQMKENKPMTVEDLVTKLVDCCNE